MAAAAAAAAGGNNAAAAADGDNYMALFPRPPRTALELYQVMVVRGWSGRKEKGGMASDGLS